MSAKTPIRTVFNASDVATGLAEYQSGEFIPLSHGGIGAALSIGSAGQVLKVNSGASALEFGEVAAIINIDAMSDGSSATLAATDKFAFSDGGTEKYILASQIDTFVSGTSATLTNKTLTAPTINGVIGGTTTSQTITTLTTSTISAGNLGVDSSGTITLDADSGAIDLADGGTQFGSLTNSSGNLIIKSGSTTAMTMSGANVTVAGNLTVEGTTTTVDSSTIQIQNAFVFEGATDDSSETTLTTVDPTADRTISLPNVSGTLPVLAVASATAITSTPEELNLLDGVSGLVQADLTKLAAVDSTATELNIIDGNTTVGTTAVADGDGIVTNDGGTMRQTTVQTFATYFGSEITAMSNLVTTGALDSGSITSGFGAIDNGTSNIRSATITAETAFVPDAADGATLGTSSLEFSDLYLADGGTIQFGNDQDVTLTHVADTGLTLKHTATADDKPIVLTLATGETDIAADDILGSIRFQAPDEGTGTDAILVAAAIDAVSEGDFSSSNNATKLSFKTGASEAASEKMTLSSTGVLTAQVVLGNTDTDTSNTGNVTLDFSANQNFVLTLTGNVTLVNPSTESVGQSGFIACIQDGTGGRTLTLGTDYESAGGAGITLSSAASATDLVPYVVVAANRILLGTPQLAFS